jgi:Protein of unknown function (DUF4229)
VVAVLKYTVLRLAIFVALLGLLAYLRAGLLLALVLAALGSMVLSYLVLRGPRTAVAQLIADRVQRRRLGQAPGHDQPLGLDDDAEAEDAAIDDAAPDSS